MVDMTSILNKPASEFKEPPQLPVGRYLLSVGPWKLGESKNHNPQIIYELNVVSPVEVADPSAASMNFPIKRRLTFTLTEGATFRHTAFLAALGLDTDQTTGDLLPQTAGRNCIGTLTLRESQNADGSPKLNPDGTQRMFGDFDAFEVAA